MIYIHKHVMENVCHKKFKIFPFAAMWVDLENIMIRKTNQDIDCIISLIGVIKKNCTSKTEHTQRYTKQTDGCQRGRGKGMDKQ